MDFHSYTPVVGRKAHRCEQCGSTIEPGTAHRKCAQVWEGEFHAYREHFECYAAWNELNFRLRSLDAYEGAQFLRDDDHEPDDRDWMREEHPIVAKRLGWMST